MPKPIAMIDWLNNHAMPTPVIPIIGNNITLPPKTRTHMRN